MSKNSILDYSTTPADNQEIGDIDIRGTAKPSNLDDGYRTGMSHIAKELVTRRSVKDTAYTAVKTDMNQLLEFSAEATLTTAAAATLTDGWQCKVYTQGGAVTINPNGSETVNGDEFIILAIGASGILSVNNGNFRFESFGGLGKSRFLANKNGVNQTIPDADTIVTFGTEVIDEGGVYDPATSRFTPLDGETYAVYAQHLVNITSGNRRVECRLIKNGSTIVARGSSHNEDNRWSQPNVSFMVVGNGTDYYQIQVNSLTSGGAYAVDGGTDKSYFMAYEI